MALLRRMWSGRPEDAEHRSNVLRAMRAQSMEFSELNVEYGYTYESAAVVPDGSPAAGADRRHPRLRALDAPGRPAAARLDRRRGRRTAAPIKDLVAPGRFLLIAGEDGERVVRGGRASWRRQTGLPLDAVRIGHLDGDLYDPRCAWLRHRQIESDGAILVRPDRFVAWRQASAADDPLAALAGALSRILARPVEPAVAEAV